MSLSRHIARGIRHGGGRSIIRHHRNLSIHTTNLDEGITLPEHIIIEYLKSDHNDHNDIQTIEKLSSIISNLPINKQSTILNDVKEGNHHPSSTLILNIQLQLGLKRLSQESNHNEVYKFIVQTINSHESIPFQPQLLETFLFNLLHIDNITSVSSLLHILFNASPHISFSNQFWSLLLAKVCQSSHYLGALIIYHHLVDNYQFYDQENYTSYANNYNNHIQFLLTPSVIENLAVIFSNNNNSSHIKGLQQYFKRFYSYVNDKKTLKSLKINLIECYSNQTNLKSALYHFRDFNYNLRGNYTFNNNSESRTSDSAKMNWSKIENLQRISNEINHQWNINNIESNINTIPTYPDDFKSPIDEIHEQLSSNLYNPDYEKNIYSNQHNSQSLALINGLIQTNDLPSFQSLITNYIRDTRNSSSSSDLANNLLSFINSNHFNLSTFVINGLAELTLFNEAYLVLSQLSNTFNKVHERNLIKLENFSNVFHHLDAQLNQAFEPQVLEFLIKFIQFYQQLDHKFDNSLPSQIYIDYLEVSLNHSSLESLNSSHILPYITILKSKSIPCIYLTKEAYELLFQICNDSEKDHYFHSGFIKKT
ncbi:hypothetical protein DFJ63DRAFT_213707 [Scheffersomyces coipomensis]|uniref:uncharacterized protein n=1 Tax=Scheffersomyces coipomensis TaxID=1788519 RepID=UPI00315D2CFD